MAASPRPRRCSCRASAATWRAAGRLSSGLALRKWVMTCWSSSLNNVACGPKNVQAKPSARRQADVVLGADGVTLEERLVSRGHLHVRRARAAGDVAVMVVRGGSAPRTRWRARRRRRGAGRAAWSMILVHMSILHTILLFARCARSGTMSVARVICGAVMRLECAAVKKIGMRRRGSATGVGTDAGQEASSARYAAALSGRPQAS